VNELVEVPFYGEAVQALRDGGAVSVVIRRVCDSLGLDFSSQLSKLKAKPWATVAMSTTVAEDGKTRELACLDLDALPMWLATIEPSRVKPEVRFKLAAYQKECARVLRDHFFGRPAPATAQPASDVVERLERRIDALLDAVATLVKSGSSATVSRIDAIWLKQEVRDIAKLQVAVGLFPGKTGKTAENSARRRIYNKLGAATGWLGTGRDWRSLPAARWPDARALLVELRREAEAMQPPKEERQLTLVK
jgi:antirepressor protein